MLKEVRKGEELNENRLRTYLMEQGLIEAESALTIQQFSNGFSNLTYLLETDTKEMVLRRPPKGAIKRGHDMGREYNVLSQIQKEYPYAPLTLAYCQDASILGSDFYIMQRVQGKILTYSYAVQNNLTKENYATISDEWLRKFSSLHQVDLAACGLQDLGDLRVTFQGKWQTGVNNTYEQRLWIFLRRQSYWSG